MIYYFTATGNDQHVAERIAEATGDRLASITAVSYTHLDVYKRQGLYRRFVEGRSQAIGWRL